MPDLQDASRAGGRGEQLIGFGQRCGHRLFDQHIDAEFQQTAADARVLDGGHGHARGVHASGERFDIRKDFGGKFGGDFRGALGVRVHDADEFGIGEFAIHARMIPPEIPRADDCDADFSDHG